MDVLLGFACSTKSGKYPPHFRVDGSYLHAISFRARRRNDRGGGGIRTHVLFEDSSKCCPISYPPDLIHSCDGGTRRAFRPCRTGRTRTCDLLIPDQLLLPLSYSPCGMGLVEPSLAEQDSNLHLPVRRLAFCQLNYPRMIGASDVLSTTSPCVFTQYFRGCWVTE